MKKSYRKNILRTVRSSLNRFLAIFAIVALGVGFLAGLLAATPDMRFSADEYFDDSRLFDLRILSPLALTEGDLAAIRAVEGVEEVMPAYSLDLLLDLPAGDTVVARLHSLPMDQIEAQEPQGWLNRFTVVEGRVPVREDECVVERGSTIAGTAAKVGDLLTVSADNRDIEDSLARTTFKVVGLVESSYYFSFEREPASVGGGALALVAYTGEENFSLPAYTDLFLTVEGAAALGSLDEAYTDRVQAVADAIEAISGQRCAIRYREVKEEAQQALDDARAEYEENRQRAETELADAEGQLEEGRAELADARSQLAQGERELADNREKLPGTLQDQQQQLAAGQAALIDARAQLEEGERQLEQQQQQLTAARAQLEASKQMVEAMDPALAQLQAQLPVLEAAIPPLQANADTARKNYEEAVASTGYEEKRARAEETQAAYEAAQATLEANGGYESFEAWQQSDPAAAAAAQAAAAAAEAERDAARQDYETAALVVDPLRTTMESAQAQLDSARLQYETARQTAETTQRQLEETRAQIAENEPLLAEGQRQLEAGQAQLADARRRLTEAEKQIASGQTALSLAPGLAQLQMELAQAKLDNARSQLADGEEELARGEAEYRSQSADARSKLEDARTQLEEAQRELDELEEPEWYILDRDTNVSFASFRNNVDKVEAVAKVFPVFFFLVAALVVLTTMTRMVEEERLQIGAMKALGYGSAAIMGKYVFYAMLASVGGAAAGLALGLTLLPTVIWNAYTMMYRLPHMYCLFNGASSLFSAVTAILCALAATLNACWATLREKPAGLLLPRAPKAGKRILLERVGPIWRRMKFTHKVTARNLFRYKKRFFMTVIGISGCTALLVAGFGLHDSISDIVNRQYGEIFTYDLTITLRREKDLQDESLLQLLRDETQVADYLAVHQEKSSNTYGRDTFTTYIYIPQQPELLPRFVDLHTRSGNQPVSLQPGGIVITEKMSERTGKGVGDTIELENNSGKTGTFTITGVVENYVENYVYLTGELYEEQFGEKPDYTLVAAHAAEESPEAREALSSRLFELDCVSQVSFIEDLKATFTNMMQKIDTIVVVLVVCAGMLAFVVLYNLTNINITERAKEIATIKVLGFFDREVSAYIYRESAVLTLFGALAGLVLGMLLHRFVIFTVEVDAVMFGRAVKPLSYLASTALTVLFSLLVNLVMHKKLKGISMVESMKAPE